MNQDQVNWCFMHDSGEPPVFDGEENEEQRKSLKAHLRRVESYARETRDYLIDENVLKGCHFWLDVTGMIRPTNLAFLSVKKCGSGVR